MKKKLNLETSIYNLLSSITTFILGLGLCVEFGIPLICIISNDLSKFFCRDNFRPIVNKRKEEGDFDFSNEILNLFFLIIWNQRLNYE